MTLLKIFSVFLLGFSLLLQGCATSRTTTHYGFFEAENSQGELRQFRVHWETIDVQGFNSRERYSTPLVLQAQCSQRAVRFYDANFRAQRACIPNDQLGIAYCGSERKDLDHRALPIEKGKACAYVVDAKGAGEIKYLGDEIQIIMRCQPKEPQVRVGRKWVNRDYLKPSSIPYVVATKTVPGSDKDGHVPQLWNHSSVCDPTQGR
ncbi:hypothetical protein A3762_13260 [Oleiphilus sp. HI0125]|uniref:hypothetical protein n=1 Tax=Oleiphilus sp. HI0125 TaxID=1822266 RepID=UPI0007C20130|nr:hypothetical protein [Oleiphilus sp. HI0125]KZZ62651.1 hypothetical protein A3762_13260 [Oleiphilus sp. HI0125]